MPKRKLRPKNGKDRHFDVSDNAIQGRTFDRLCKQRRRLQSPKTRREIDEVQSLDAEIERRRVQLPPTPPIVLKERASRGRRPSCLYFGLRDDFKRRYPGYKFCSHCEEWESYNRARISKKIKRDSQRFICQGDHDNWVHPSTKTRKHYTLCDMFNACAAPEEEDVDYSIFYRESEAEQDVRDMLLLRQEQPQIQPQTRVRILPAGSNQPTSTTVARGGSTSPKRETQETRICSLATRVETLEEEILSLKKENATLNQRIKAAYRKTWSLSTRLKKPNSTRATQKVMTSQEDEKELITALLSQLQTIGNKHRSKKCRLEMINTICDSILSNRFFHGSVKDQCNKRFRDYLRKEVYSPWKILRAMDLSGGGLCYNGIEILREVETLGRKYYRNSILPSAAEMKRTAKIVERFANSKGLDLVSNVVDDTVNESVDGAESMEFKDISKVMQFITKAFKLDQIAQSRSISVSAAIDAAQLSKRHIHTTMGIKVNDKEAVCPLSNQPIFGSLQGAGRATTLVQSRNNCFPLKIILAKETKGIYKHFSHVFNLFTVEDEQVEEAAAAATITTTTNGNSTAAANEEQEEQASVPTSSLLGAGSYPIRCCVNCDMSAQWKGLCRGSAMKSGTYACQCCAIHSQAIAKPNRVKCDKWCREYQEKFPDTLGHDDWKCYHHDILTDEKLTSMQGELDELKQVMEGLANRMEHVTKHSKIDVTEDPHTYAASSKSSNNICSIHYDIEAAARRSQTVPSVMADVREHSQNISLDLVLRRLDHEGGIIEKRERLRASLIQEFTVREYQTNISHGKLGADEALFVLMNTPPCILHLENRVGLKMFQLLLQIGLKNVERGEIICRKDGYGDEETQSESLRIKYFFRVIHDCVNTEIWGTQDNPTQWECPYNKGDKEIQSITLDNNRTRDIIGSLDLLVDICIADESDANTWKEAVESYRLALDILRSRQDLSDSQILEFQQHIDTWFEGWMRVSGGRRGVTNYIHMLSSGHVSEYLFKWRNLYVHSQQGWESLNSMIKTFFLRRTGRGSAGRGEKSRLKPLGRWFQRRLLWMTGYTMADFSSTTNAALAPRHKQEDEHVVVVQPGGGYNRDKPPDVDNDYEQEMLEDDIHNMFLV